MLNPSRSISSSFEQMESVNKKLTLFLFEEEGLIYSTEDNRLHLLNSLGMYVWLLLEDGLSKSEVLALYRKHSTTQSAEFIELIDELYLLFMNGYLPSDLDEQEEIWLQKIPSNSSETNHQGFYHKILDSNIVVTYCDQFSKKTIEPLLGVFIHTGQVYCDYLIDITMENEEYQIGINGFYFSWRIPKKKLAAVFNDRIRKLVFTQSDYFLASHAAVLAKGDKCLMMPAVSYSGKSTLSVALISADYQYFSDEMAVIDKNHQARPVPLGIGLKSGSWDVLKSYMPQLAQLKEQQRWDGVPLKYVPVDGSIRHGINRKQVSHLVFPKYTQSQKAELIPLSIPRAVYQLFEAGFTMQGEFSKKQVTELLGWVESVPAYQFKFSQLDEAIECLEAL